MYQWVEGDCEVNSWHWSPKAIGRKSYWMSHVAPVMGRGPTLRPLRCQLSCAALARTPLPTFASPMTVSHGELIGPEKSQVRTSAA